MLTRTSAARSTAPPLPNATDLGPIPAGPAPPSAPASTAQRRHHETRKTEPVRDALESRIGKDWPAEEVKDVQGT